MKKWGLYILLSTLFMGGVYLYVWEKPKWEAFILAQIESYVKNHDFPARVNIGKVKLSLLPLQLEAFETHFKPQKLKDMKLSPFQVRKIVVRPSLLDMVIGKFWLSQIQIKGARLDIKLPLPEKGPDQGMKKIQLDIDKYLRKSLLSQIHIQDIQLNLNIGDRYFLKTESLYVRAFNAKTSLILTLKDSKLGVKPRPEGGFFHFLTDLQVMVTKNTLSLSRIKIVKGSSFFLASGNVLYKNNNFNDIDAFHIKTRFNSNFQNVREEVNFFHKTEVFNPFQGAFKFDLELDKSSKSKDIKTSIKGGLKKFKIGRVALGDMNFHGMTKDWKRIFFKKIGFGLVGRNSVEVKDLELVLGESGKIQAGVQIKKFQVRSFLKQSGIVDIPLWVEVEGALKCLGTYQKSLKVNCPGVLRAKNLKLNIRKDGPLIVAAKQMDLEGSIELTEKAVSYKTKIKMEKSHGESKGVINFKEGFDISYQTEALDFKEVGPLFGLVFLGQGKISGSTQGDSRSAVFKMDTDVEDFEFQDFFFGNLKTRLNYKSGHLFLKNIDGLLESTRFNGTLDLDLRKYRMKGDIRLPFFRMNDIQQIVFKKVDFQNRFIGSGSARLRMETPLKLSDLNFDLDAQLFKGKVFGEEYNELELKAKSLDGVITIEKGLLQKASMDFLMKGTIDTALNSKLSFVVNKGALQLSTLLKEYGLPISGKFLAQGTIVGKLAAPIIKVESEIKDMVFNKKKYGAGLFSFDNSNKQTNIQFQIKDKLEMILLFPESNYQLMFLNAKAHRLDMAPLISFGISGQSAGDYLIESSWETQGQLNSQSFWNSEFSSVIKEIKFDYKSNQMETSLPINIKIKDSKIFLNEVKISGKDQYLKIHQPYREKLKTQFVIDSKLHMSFFKIFAPFLEKINGYGNLNLELSIHKENFKFIGSAYAKESLLKFPGFPHAIENLSADVLFNQKKVLINTLSGEMAGGRVFGNGEVRFGRKKDFDLSIHANMEDVNIHFPEGFHTSGNGHIQLSGSQLPFLLSGEYNVNEGLIDSNFAGGETQGNSDLIEDFFKEDLISPLSLDLDIKTKNPVEIRNNFVEGYILGDIKVYDRITAPRIKGEAYFDDNAIVRFRDQEFQVISSLVNFEGKSPIDPKLSLRSITRLNNYDINLFLQGRAGNPLLSWTSQPPLPESQIISMLALGTLPDQFNQTSATNINNNSTQNFEVGTSLLSNNPLGKELKDKYDVDVQFSSSFDDQNNTAVPKVTVRHRMTRDFQISVSATSGNTNQQTGRASYELTDDLSAIFSITNQPGNTNNLTNPSQIQRANRFGLDVEYRKEFD